MDFRLIQDQLILESSELGHHPEMESYYEPTTGDGDNYQYVAFTLSVLLGVTHSRLGRFCIKKDFFSK